MERLVSPVVEKRRGTSVLPVSRRDVLRATFGMGLGVVRVPCSLLFAEEPHSETIHAAEGKYQKRYQGSVLVSEEFTPPDRRAPLWMKNYEEEKLVQQWFFRRSGNAVSLHIFDDEGEVKGTCLYREDERGLWSYDLQPGEMTAEMYLNHLKDFLTDWETIHAYRQYCFQYEWEPPGEDHWMTPVEAIRSTRQGRVHGDCDDFAFLMQDILRRRNVRAPVVSLEHPSRSSHAICLALEEHPRGTYHAITACTRGIDVNGNLFGGKEWDSAKERGYVTKVDAFNATLRRYWSDFFVHISDPDVTLWILELGSAGKQTSREVRVRDLPVTRGGLGHPAGRV